MRIVNYFFFVFLITLLSCVGSSLPDGVLPRKKMVPILVDIHLSEAINNQKYNFSLKSDSLPEELYLSVCKKHKVDRSILEKSLLYYGKHTGEYIPIYNDVLDVLSALEIKIKSDTVRVVPTGGFDRDTAEINKSALPSGKKDSLIK